MTLQQTIAALPLKEFAQLCVLVDFVTGEPQKKFLVISVDRTPARTRVLVDLGKGVLQLYEIGTPNRYAEAAPPALQWTA